MRGRSKNKLLTENTAEPLVRACHTTHFSPCSDLTVCIVMAEPPGTTNSEGGGEITQTLHKAPKFFAGLNNMLNCIARVCMHGSLNACTREEESADGHLSVIKNSSL